MNLDDSRNGYDDTTRDGYQLIHLESQTHMFSRIQTFIKEERSEIQ